MEVSDHCEHRQHGIYERAQSDCAEKPINHRLKTRFSAVSSYSITGNEVQSTYSPLINPSSHNFVYFFVNQTRSLILTIHCFSLFSWSSSDERPRISVRSYLNVNEWAPRISQQQAPPQ